MAEAPKVKKTFTRVLQGVHETLREKLNYKRVGEILISPGTKLNKTLRKEIKRAIKTDNVEYFFSVLSQMFNLKSLVIFLEVVDSTVSENPNHKQILSILCHDLGELSSLEKESQETIERLEEIRKKYVFSSAPVVLYYEHEVEKFSFDKSGNHYFYSPKHDVSVLIDPAAFPEVLDKFDLYLKANDYSQPISIPQFCSGMYSALINLTCKPHFDRFQDYVTVTLPHCAIADTDRLCEDLCVLSGADGSRELEEDPEILIDFIDKHYITFRTKHFSNSLASSTQKRRQKYCDLRMRKMRAALSLDGGPATHSSTIARRRANSSPSALPRKKIASKFCVQLCRPRDISNHSNWQFVFIVATDNLTFTKEIPNHAMTLLGLPDTVELVFTEAPFTFTSDYITLNPNLCNKNGWTISSEVKPAEIIKDRVKQYWRLPPTERQSINPPYIRYTATREEPGGHLLEHTSFSISLNGSQSLGKRETIVVEVPCHLKPDTSLLQPNSIKIIRNMYFTNSGYSSIFKAVVGDIPSSLVQLKMDDKYCRILFCEISFHLPRWKRLGECLGMPEEYICEVQINHERSTYFHEPAFQMLMTWLQRSQELLTVQDLVTGLRRMGTRLQITTWSTSHNYVPHNLNSITTLFLAQDIQHHWKFIARLVGESETDIHTIVQQVVNGTILQQADSMIEQLKKRVIDDDLQANEFPHPALTSLEVFNSIHCIWEHINFEPLNNALSLFR